MKNPKIYKGKQANNIMARTLDTAGCEFGRMYKLQFENFSKDVADRFDRTDKKLEEISKQNVELFNHQSSRWAPSAGWTVSIVSLLLGIALTFAANKLLGA